MSDASDQGTPICERCLKNPAVVHVRRVSEGEEEGLYVCRSCATQLGANPAQVAQVQGAMAGDPLTMMLRSLEEPSQAEVCPGCGLHYEKFKETGRLGCATCWATFSEDLDTLLLRLQGKTRHRGRSPEREGEQYVRASRIKRLNDELERAVGAEQYERAAELRDLLKELIGVGKDGSHE